MKKAFITGITGQDGSYLAELLLSKEYEVYGLVRISSGNNISRIEHLKKNKNFHLCYGDITDESGLYNIIKETNPQEIYNLAALSHIQKSFIAPIQTTNINSIGTLNLLEAIRTMNIKENVKFYQASTSEMFGNNNSIIQTELSNFVPQSPYACSKLFAYWISVIYRKAYGIFASNGILFNHESVRRDKDYVTRKISIGASKIKLGLEKKLYLGNLSTKRDWGHSKDFVYGMYKILQQDKPDDFILSTGITTSIRDFCKKVFAKLDIEIEFQNSGIDEKGYNKKTGECIIEVDPSLYRPIDVDNICGDSSKARKLLNWTPKYSLDDIIDEMLEYDLKQLKSNN